MSSPQTVGVDSGEYCIIWLGPEFPGDQRRDDACSLTFDGPPLASDIDIVGAPVIHLMFSSDKPVAFVAARLNSVWPDGAVSRLSYQLMNLAHRHGHEHPAPLLPGRSYEIRIKLDDTAVRVPRGHRLRVSLSTTYWPLLWPAPEPVTLAVETGTSFIEIPVRETTADESEPVLPAPESPSSLRRRTLEAPWNKREVTTDLATGETRLTIVDDFGRAPARDLGARARNLHHPARRSALGAPGVSLERGDRPRIMARANRDLVGADRQQGPLALRARLEAYEGKRKTLTRKWDEKIEHNLG